MRKLARILAFAAALWVNNADAQVQSPQTLPANTVWGRLGIGAGPGQALPFNLLGANLFISQPAHSVILGEGGVNPIGSVGPGTTGLPLVANGASTDPSYQLLTTAGIAAATIVSGNIASNTILGSNIASNTVANANLANMAAGTVKCNQNTGTTPQDCSPVAADKIIYVSTGGNDSNSGASPFFPKLTLQAAQNAANPNGIVYVGAGTYSLSTKLSPQPGVRMTCAPGAIITQNNAANLNPLIDFTTNTAARASLDHCIIDGNRANNTDDLGGADLIHMVGILTVNDVLIEESILRNGNGDAIFVTTGVRPIIRGNQFTNFYGPVISIVTGVAATATYAQIIDNILLPPIGERGIYITQSDYATICRNTISPGLALGHPGSLLNVSSSGTTITWVSGPQFTTVSPGQYLVTSTGGYTESIINSVTSATQLVVAIAPPALTNNAASIGSGDLIDVNNSSFFKVCDNTLFGGAIDGISPNSVVLPNGESAQKGSVIGNNISYSGEMAIRIASGAGTATVQDIGVFNNVVVNPGQSAAAAGTVWAMQAIGGQAAPALFFEGNQVNDDTAQTAYWLSVSSAPAGSVQVGANYQRGAANPGIIGGISSVTLSAGWGTTASSTNISHGNSFIVTVTSSGTGQAANPSVTVNTVATKPATGNTAGNFPVACKQTGGTGAVQLVYNESQFSTPSATVFNWNGTPAAASTYIFTCE